MALQNRQLEESAKMTLLNDLRKVGPSKPLGYLPISTITELCGVTVEDMIQEAEQKGLSTRIIYGNVYSGALYVWDETALNSHLAKHSNILGEAGWPMETVPFIEMTDRVTAPSKTPLFDLIADAYGDSRNPGRLTLHKNPTSDAKALVP